MKFTKDRSPVIEAGDVKKCESKDEFLLVNRPSSALELTRLLNEMHTDGYILYQSVSSLDEEDLVPKLIFVKSIKQFDYADYIITKLKDVVREAVDEYMDTRYRDR